MFQGRPYLLSTLYANNTAKETSALYYCCILRPIHMKYSLNNDVHNIFVYFMSFCFITYTPNKFYPIKFTNSTLGAFLSPCDNGRSYNCDLSTIYPPSKYILVAELYGMFPLDETSIFD